MFRRTTHIACISALLANTMLTPFAFAQVATVGNKVENIAGSGANAYVAPNGVPVVNIATPNGAGLSHNKYLDYNVPTNGLVLNNSGVVAQSKLAGYLVENRNISGGDSGTTVIVNGQTYVRGQDQQASGPSARFILNEVVSSNRSTMQGFTEILGSSAELIIANPNGITCNGCGFINTPRVTVSTGVPRLDGNGALSALSVGQGDILITGNGLNGSDQNILDLVARSVRVAGAIRAKDLQIVAGTNSWGYDSRTATAEAPSGTAPTVAIDSSALGGMYANRIRLIATEAGVGVRMLAGSEAAATAEDFNIQSNGTVMLAGSVSAQTDLSVTSRTSGAAVALDGGTLSAGQDVTLTATAGNTTLTGGTVTANRDLTISTADLTDNAQGNGSDANKRYASRSSTVTATGAARLNGTTHQSGGSMAVTARSLDVGSDGATLVSGSRLTATTTDGDMALGTAAASSTGDMSLTSQKGGISTSAATGKGVRSVSGNITVQAKTSLNNAGAISADTGALTVTSTSGSTLAVTNSGTLQAKNGISITGSSTPSALTLTNTASGIILGDTLAVTADTVSNAGTLQGSNGTALSAATSITNSASGKIIAANTANKDGTLSTGNLTNAGIIQSAGTLQTTVGTGLNNSGKLLATGDLSVRGSQASAYTLTNSGRIQSSGGALSVTGKNGTNAVTLTNSGSTSELMGKTATLTVDSVTNEGTIQSEQDLTLTAQRLTQSTAAAAIIAANSGTGSGTLTVAQAISNGGAIHSGSDFSLTAPDITNTATGGISAIRDLRITASTGAVTNNGALYSGRDMTVAASSTLLNAGNATLDSGQDVTLTADAITNKGKIVAARDITATSRLFTNQLAGGDPTKRWSSRKDVSNVIVVPHRDVDGNGLIDDEQEDWRETWHEDEEWVNAPSGATPQIISGRNMTVTTNTGRNIAGLMSAGGTMTLTGSGADSSFTNESPFLQRKDYTRNYNLFWDCYFGGCDGPETREDGTTFNLSTTAELPSHVRALSLSVTGFNSLRNISSTTAVSSVTNSGSPTGASATSLSKAGATTTTTGATAITLTNLGITLPTSPNGRFVLAKDPSASYLIESNPRFGAQADYLGSDYLLRKLVNKSEFDPNPKIRRLGDAAYETTLIRQQVIDKTGTSLLKSGETEKQFVQRLYDNTLKLAETNTGLTLGKPLTPQQIASLKEDIVWMVEVEVNGTKVLAPQVYLAQSTLDSLNSGATMTAENTTINVDTVTNTGGTLGGSENLSITAKGDITNTSGTISGGAVSLTSTEGSITNKTVADGNGSDKFYTTNIGKTASIGATGNLSVNAAKDITNTGAAMTAGGNADLSAGGNVTFDTIQNKTASTTTTRNGGFFSSSETTTTTTQIKQIGSELSAGGNLTVKSGKDITLAGTTVSSGGDASLDATNNINILAREDSTQTKSETKTSGLFSSSSRTEDKTETKTVGTSMNAGQNLTLKSGKDTTIQGSTVAVSKDLDVTTGGDFKVLAGQDKTITKTTETESGLGVGGGLYGIQSTETNSFVGKNAASTVTAGGNVTVKSGGDMVLQGSDVKADGDVDIDAKSVKVLAGRDEEHTTTKTTTVTFLSTSSESDSGADAKASSAAEDRTAEASAEAGAEASNSSEFNLMKATTTTTQEDRVTHVASNLTSGGKMTIKSASDLTVHGSNVESGGDMDVTAQKVSISSAEDTYTKTTKSTSIGIGIYSDSEASASADASASASGKARTAAAEANASAEATNSTTIGVRAKTSEEYELEITNQASTLKSGGTMSVTAKETLTVKGSDIEAGGDVDLKAKSMEFLAAEDKKLSTSSSNTLTAGIGIDSRAGAEASASANADGRSLSGNAQANAEASAEVGIGLSASNKDERSVESETTARTSTIKSGGNMTRTAENKILDVGTQIEAGGDFSQSAGTIESRAARNETYSSSSSETNTAKIGLYADAKAEAAAGTTPDAAPEAGANASAGVKVSYSNEKEKETSSSSTAVVSSIKAGGKLTSISTDKTSLEGTTLSSDGDMTLEAKSLEVTAARDTETSSKSSSTIEAGLKVGKSVGTDPAGAKVAASAGYEDEGESASSSTAVVGSITAGGNLRIKTSGDASFEGTAIEAGGDAKVDAGGDLTFSAARDTSSESTSKTAVSAEFTTTKSDSGREKELGFEAEVGRSSESTDDAVTASIKSGGTLSLSAAKNATFEGTAIEGGGDTEITAGGDVTMKAARNTASESSLDANISATIGADEQKGQAGLSGGKANESTATVSTITSGGDLRIKAGRDVTLEGTEAAADGKATLEAGRNVAVTAAENTSSSVEGGISVSGAKGEDGSKVKGAGAVSGETSKDAVTGSISGGKGLDIKAGNNASFEGAALESGADTSISAGNNVTFRQATSSSIGGSFGISGGQSDGAASGVGTATIGGSAERQNSSITTEGALSIQSGGKTTLGRTEIDIKGN